MTHPNEKYTGMEAHYRYMTQELPVFINIVSPTGKFLMWNKYAERILGYTSGEAIGKLTPYDIHDSKKEVDDIIRTVKSKGIYEGEIYYKHKNGRLFPVHLIVVPGDKDNKGNITSLFGFAEDITDRKNAEQTLAELEANYHSIFEIANDAIIINDIKTYEIIDANNKACEMFCRHKDEMIGFDLKMFVTQNGTLKKIRRLYDDSAKGTPQLFEWLVKDKFGREFWIEVNTKRGVIGGRYRVMSIARDITERKREMSIKDDFMNMVSHELRTPLSAIKEGVSLVSENNKGTIDKEKKEILDIVKRNIDRLARLIDQVLDFQKFDSGMMRFKPEMHDINDIIKEIHRTMISLATKNKLELKLELGDNLPRVCLDRDRIIEVIENLVSNAIKHTAKGSITIASDKGDNFVMVSVIDTGSGVRQEDMSKLFKRFSQIERRSGGSGLGLAISKEIIEKHNGKIWAESACGLGLTVRFILPIEERRGYNGEKNTDS